MSQYTDKQELPSLGTPPAGSIRFNTDSNKMEIYNGEQWWEIDSTSPNEQTGGTRALSMGGSQTGGTTNAIEFANISSTGNFADFGDMTATWFYHGGCSDSNGGLGE